MGVFFMGNTFFPGDIMFQIVPIFIGLVFIIVIGFILFSVVKGVGQWQKNNNSPRLSVPAMVKTKRTHVSRRGSVNNEHSHHSTRTTYYITFEFESGDRTEFQISGTEYGQLAEEDQGILSFQGTRYLSFERN
jgi:ABC-type transport system involved in multi-copper enzyme maturation permease subunit